MGSDRRDSLPDDESPSAGAVSGDAAPFVRNDQSKRDRQRFPLGHAFRCAADGVVCAVTSQRNFRIHIVVAVAALALAVVLGLDAPSVAVVALCVALVMAAECVNTAVEAVVDLVSPEYHELARRAKDCAAGAVLICAAGSVVAGVLLFAPPLLALLRGCGL